MSRNVNGAPRNLTDERHQNWIFDLDNTLYPSHCDLFKQMDVKMSAFIGRLLDVDPVTARKIQKGYLHAHGTTLNGLMHEHKINPDHFLDYVHDLDLSPVPPNPELAASLGRLPGQKYVFTNGSVAHAEKVMDRLGVSECFDGIFDIAAADYVPKPNHETYERFLKHYDVDPDRSVMFEDISRNLVSPEKMGMATVLVHSSGDWMGDHKQKESLFHHDNHDHVHHFADDLTEFLQSALQSGTDMD
jgi:putative hydrolase of the HAD superfamily